MEDDLHDDLSLLEHDAYVLPGKVFSLIYPNVYRFFGGDNTPRLCTNIASPWSPPLKLHQRVPHRTPPRKKDIVVVQTDEGDLYGSICWANPSENVVCLYMFKEKKTESFELDCLESHHERNIRWRIVQ